MACVGRDSLAFAEEDEFDWTFFTRKVVLDTLLYRPGVRLVERILDSTARDVGESVQWRRIVGEERLEKDN